MALVQSDIDSILDKAQGGTITKASATITLSTGVPVADDTLVVNGVTFTFVAEPVGAYEIDIAGTIDAQITEIAAVLNASTDNYVQEASYTADLDNDQLDVEYKVAGEVGNTFTLAATFDTAANVSIAGAATVTGDGTSTTLTGGAAVGGTKYLSSEDTGGTIVANRLDDVFEANVVTLISLVEFVLANSQDPTSNESIARRQRKILKEVLNRMAASIKPASNRTASDVAAISTKVASDAVARYNYKPRSEDI